MSKTKFAKFTVLDNNSPTVPDPFEIHLDPSRVVAVQPKNEDQSSLRLDVNGPLGKIDVEGDLKATKKKLN